VSVVTLHDPDIFGVEPNGIFALQQLVSGDKLYTNLEQPPFSHVLFPPLYYVLTAKAATLLRIDPRQDVWSLYAVARTISLAFYLMIAIVLYFLCVEALGLHASIAFVVACLSLLVPSVHGIAARPDSLVRLLTLVAFFCYLRIESVESQTRRYALLAVSVGLVILAIFTKQTAVQMLLIFGLLSALRKRWSELALIPVLSLVLGVMTYYLLAGFIPSFYTFYQNVVIGAPCRIDLDWTTYHLEAFFFRYGLLVSLFLATAYGHFSRRDRAAYDVTALHVAAGVMLVVFLLETLRMGIALNHAYEPITFMILAVVSFLARDAVFAAEPARGRLLTVVTLALYISVFSLSQTGSFLYRYHAAWWHRERDRLELATQEQVVRSLKQELDLRPGSRFFAYWLPYVNLRLFDRAIMPQLDLVVYCTVPEGMFHNNEFAAEIKSGRINWIVKRREHDLSSFAGVNLERFHPFTTIGRYTILRQEE
jgi:hypothetical protein